MATLQQSNPDSAVGLDLTDTSRVCSACGTTVARRDCHKNRYSEYICHQCQREGISFTRREQLRYLFRWSPARAFLLLMGLALILLVAWALYKYLE